MEGSELFYKNKLFGKNFGYKQVKVNSPRLLHEWWNRWEEIASLMINPDLTIGNGKTFPRNWSNPDAFKAVIPITLGTSALYQTNKGE